jgi:ankyrin repeat protein
LVAGPFGDGRSARARHKARGALAELPADVDRLHEGRTLLHAAAWDGDLDRIRALLAAGADPTIQDRRFGGRPLDWAVHAFQTEAESLLRQVTPDIPPEATTGATPDEV